MPIGNLYTVTGNGQGVFITLDCFTPWLALFGLIGAKMKAIFCQKIHALWLIVKGNFLVLGDLFGWLL